MDIAAVIAALDTRFDATEAAIVERMLREHSGSALITDNCPIATTAG